MKILNLFAGIGGNRNPWGNNHQITAIENDEKIAKLYRKRFPNDIIIIDNAYDYCEKYFEEFDFIWASPPCPTHSKLNTMRKAHGLRNTLPDLRLYSLILFLQKWYYGKWVVENVVPYYLPLIKPTVELKRHLFWANQYIIKKEFPSRYTVHDQSGIKELAIEYNIDLSLFDGITLESIKKRQILRNCVREDVSLYIFNTLRKKPNQKTLL